MWAFRAKAFDTGKGGAIVYRIAVWFPELVKEIFSVCTPFGAPSKRFVSIEDLVQNRMPHLGYQIQLASGEVEKNIRAKEEIGQFLNAAYGGQGPDGEQGFHVRKGLLLENLPKLAKTPLMDERTLEYYVEQFTRSGVHSGRKSG